MNFQKMLSELEIFTLYETSYQNKRLKIAIHCRRTKNNVVKINLLSDDYIDLIGPKSSGGL